MIEILIKIIFFGFLLNVAYHLPHSLLYETVYKLPLKKYVRLMLVMPAKDGFFIALFYSITVLLWHNWYILENPLQLGCFVVMALTFAFINERASLKMGRWEYTPSMPLLFGVGLTPLLEIAVTGILTFIIIFLF